MVKNSISSYLLLIILLAICASGYAQTFTYLGFTYTVNADRSTVAITGGAVDNSSPLIIPDVAYYNDKVYPVTIIKDGAFKQYIGPKVVIGDNVTTIEGKAFEHFAEHQGNCTLILGRSIKSMPNKAFEHFGEHGDKNKIIVKCDQIPTIVSGTFEHIDNTTIYVRDKTTFDDYKKANIWGSYDESANKKNIKYAYPFPYEYEFESGKWLTAVFPISMSEHTVLSNFGQGTIVAYLKTAKYDKEAKEYQLHFEYTKAIEANTPYLIKIGNSNSDFVSDTEGDPNAATLTKSVSIENKSGYEAQMIGVYSQHTLSENEFYLRNTDGKLFFYLATGDDGSFVGVNKCYFEILDQSGNVAPAKFSCYFNNSGEATAIRSIPSLRAGCLKKGVFNLSGQHVGDDPAKLTGGTYIVNGKKTFIRHFK